MTRKQKKATRMNLNQNTHEKKASEEVLQALQELHRVMGEVGQIGDPFASAVRIIYPSQAETILQSSDGSTDDVRLVDTGLAALGLDRRTCGSNKPPHSYERGDYSPAGVKAEIAKQKERNPHMFR